MNNPSFRGTATAWGALAGARQAINEGHRSVDLSSLLGHKDSLVRREARKLRDEVDRKLNLPYSISTLGREVSSASAIDTLETKKG